MSRRRQAKEDWSLLIPYVLDGTGVRVSVADATRGLEYFCPECGQPVQVREGDLRRKHCAHLEYIVRCEFREDGADRALARHALLHAVLLRAEGRDVSPILIVRQCSYCHRRSEQPMPAAIVQAKLKYPVSHTDDVGLPRRADVALLDVDVTVRCLVQIVRERNSDAPKFAGFIESPWILLHARRTLKDPRRLIVQAEGNLSPWKCPHCSGHSQSPIAAAVTSPAHLELDLRERGPAEEVRYAQNLNVTQSAESTFEPRRLETLDLVTLERRLSSLEELLRLAGQSSLASDWQTIETAYRELRRELSDWATHPGTSAEVYRKVSELRTRCIAGWKRAQVGGASAT